MFCQNQSVEKHDLHLSGYTLEMRMVLVMNILMPFTQDFIGAVECTLGAIIGEHGGRMTKQLV